MSDLDNVKVGDVVLYSDRYRRQLVTVTSVTKQHFCISGGPTKYRKISGRAVGASQWDTACICVPTPEQIAEVYEAEKRSRLYYKLGKVYERRAQLSEHQIERILAIANEGMEEV